MVDSLNRGGGLAEVGSLANRLRFANLDGRARRRRLAREGEWYVKPIGISQHFPFRLGWMAGGGDEHFSAPPARRPIRLARPFANCRPGP